MQRAKYKDEAVRQLIDRGHSFIDLADRLEIWRIPVCARHVGSNQKKSMYLRNSAGDTLK